jgi:formamidopyrimidine-DNA glycosylase
MPELPEVETVRRGLAPVLVGRAFERVEQRRPDLRFPLPGNFAARLRGQKIERLERRAKYLLAHLSGGDVLLMHLGMTGRFSVHADTNSGDARPLARASRGDARRLDGHYTHRAGGALDLLLPEVPALSAGAEPMPLRCAVRACGR